MPLMQLQRQRLTDAEIVPFVPSYSTWDDVAGIENVAEIHQEFIWNGEKMTGER